jgi:adenylate cyclase
MEWCRKHPGGAEVEMTLLFADMRGSTRLAEQSGPKDYARVLKRFYSVATDVLIRTDAFIDKIVGDEVVGWYIPLFAGPTYPRKAIDAAQELLRGAGYDAPDRPKIPIGIGVHTGAAFVGTIQGAEGTVTDMAAMGVNVNLTARLASQAGEGEALVTEATFAAANLDFGDAERRQLVLKGLGEPVTVGVLRVERVSQQRGGLPNPR